MQENLDQKENSISNNLFWNIDSLLSYNAILNFVVGERRSTVNPMVLKNMLLNTF